jgi:radical SAM superfamily enzyme YgiQ (UPF0313 family)
LKILFIYADIVTIKISYCPAIHVLSSILKQIGCNIGLLHINENIIPFEKNIIIEKSNGYDIFAFTATSFNYKYANQIAGWLKEQYPNILRILGGSHATIQPEDFEESNFDIFCVGEGEEPMKDLVYALQNGIDWNNIPNLITRKRINPVRGFLKDMNLLPFWDFEITDTKRILELQNGWLSLSFSRGCPYECNFCINHLYKKIEIGQHNKISEYLRKRSPENAILQLEYLANNYKIKFFNIDDDLHLIDKKWIIEFTEKYKKRIYERFGIKYILNARASNLTKEILTILDVSGCKEIRIGFETGNEKLRNKILGKGITNDDLIKAFENLKGFSIIGVLFAMMGIPGESWETFNDTLDMIIKLKPKLIRMTFLFPYKHTRIYDYCIENNLFKEGKIMDNRDIRSPLVFENLTDIEISCFRFLFAWFVNFRWFKDFEYYNAIQKYINLELSEFETKFDEIIEIDKGLDKNCFHSHYRYFPNNRYYFEYVDI